MEFILEFLVEFAVWIGAEYLCNILEQYYFGYITATPP
jgi:hypothetical protein